MTQQQKPKWEERISVEDSYDGLAIKIISEDGKSYEYVEQDGLITFIQSLLDKQRNDIFERVEGDVIGEDEDVLSHANKSVSKNAQEIYFDEVKQAVEAGIRNKLRTKQRQILQTIKNEGEDMSKILVRIGVRPNKETKTCITSLDEWLSGKNIKFESVDFARFEQEVMLATIEFDRNNMIYIILPKRVFETMNKQRQVLQAIKKNKYD